jgi:hypothetical protein
MGKNIYSFFTAFLTLAILISPTTYALQEVDEILK